MCIKLGSDELDTVRNLMRMSLMALVSEALEVDIEQLDGVQNLRTELGMDTHRAAALQTLIADYFDGLDLDPSRCDTLDALLDQVVDHELADTV